MAKRAAGKAHKQIAALPIARAPDGALQILAITSRETRRLVVPKGWPMRGVEDREAAEIEAREEAGLIGRAHPKPVGSYLAWKRRDDGFQLVKVQVFLFDVKGQLATWKEKGQREMVWLDIDEAAALFDEPGLSQLVLDLPERLPKSWRSRAGTTFEVAPLRGRETRALS